MTTRERVPARLAWTAALVAVAGVYAWLSRRYQIVLLLPYGDAWAHLAAIRRTLEVGVFPGDLFYTDGAPSPPYYSLAHVIFAALTRLTGLAPHEVWLAMPPWIAVMDVAAAYVFLRRLTADAGVAVVGTAADLLLHASGHSWTSLSFPNAVAMGPYYLAWYAYLRGRPERRFGWLLLSGAALGLCFDTHLFVGGLCAVGLLLLELALMPRQTRTAAPLFLVLAVGLLVASPWVGSYANAWMHRDLSTAPVFAIDQKSLAFQIAGLHLRILDPWQAIDTMPLPLWFAVAVGLALSLLRLVRHEATIADRYAVFATATALAIAFTPAYGVAIAFLGVWSPRVLLLFPFSLLIGTGIVSGLRGLATSSLPAARRLVLAAAGLALLAWIGVAVFDDIDQFATTWEYGDALRRLGPFGWDLADQLAARGPLPRIVLSDPQTAYVLAYLIGSHAVVILPEHGSPFVDHATRMKAARDFYTPGTTSRALHQVLDAWGVDTVAIALDRAWPHKGQADQLLRRLRDDPAFVEVGCCGRLVFLRYQGGVRSPNG